MSSRRAKVRSGTAAPGGFTLLEVVIALLVLEIAVVGATGILVLASASLGRAERLERAAALAEGILDSLATEAVPAPGSASDGPAAVEWSVGPAGTVTLVAVGPVGDTLFDVVSVLPPAGTP